MMYTVPLKAPGVGEGLGEPEGDALGDVDGVADGDELGEALGALPFSPLKSLRSIVTQNCVCDPLQLGFNCNCCCATVKGALGTFTVPPPTPGWLRN